MLGMELDIEGKPVMDKAREKGLLINVTKGKVLRFLPPLVIKKAEIDEAVFILEESFKEI